MLQVRPGDVVYSRRHKCLLYCFGRNGGRPHVLFGRVMRNGEPDPETWKLFEAGDVEAVWDEGGNGLRMVLPGTVAATYELPVLEGNPDIFALPWKK